MSTSREHPCDRLLAGQCVYLQDDGSCPFQHDPYEACLDALQGECHKPVTQSGAMQKCSLGFHYSTTPILPHITSSLGVGMLQPKSIASRSTSSVSPAPTASLGAILSSPMPSNSTSEFVFVTPAHPSPPAATSPTTLPTPALASTVSKANNGTSSTSVAVPEEEPTTHPLPHPDRGGQLRGG